MIKLSSKQLKNIDNISNIVIIVLCVLVALVFTYSIAYLNRNCDDKNKNNNNNSNQKSNKDSQKSNNVFEKFFYFINQKKFRTNIQNRSPSYWC